MYEASSSRMKTLHGQSFRPINTLYLLLVRWSPFDLNWLFKAPELYKEWPCTCYYIAIGSRWLPLNKKENQSFVLKPPLIPKIILCI